MLQRVTPGETYASFNGSEDVLKLTHHLHLDLDEAEGNQIVRHRFSEPSSVLIPLQNPSWDRPQFFASITG